MSYREANWSLDKDRITAALINLEYDSHRYDFVYKPNYNSALNYIFAKCASDDLSTADAFIVDDTYLLLVSQFSPWCSDDIILQEELVLTLGPAGQLHEVTNTLNDLAFKRGANHIIVSDSSPGLRLSSLYRRAGYIHITNQFYKGV